MASRGATPRSPLASPPRIGRGGAAGGGASSGGDARTPARSPAGSPRRAQDRFVPTRSAMDFDMSFHKLTNENLASETLLEDDYSAGLEYKSILSKMLFDGSHSKILRYAGGSGAAGGGAAPDSSSLHQVFLQNMSRSPHGTSHRQISHTPEKILDAPDLLDDYYLNLLDWSCQNVLAVALGQTVYLWNAHTGSISQLTHTTEPEDYVAALSFSADGKYIAVGTNNAEAQLFDTEQMKLVRTLRGHTQRISSLSWNGHTLSTGSRDANIKNHDTRAPAVQSTLDGHQQEVCGLRWSPDGKQLASGGNDSACLPAQPPCHRHRHRH